MAITDLLKYTYKVGEKGAAPIPFAVKLSMDKDFKKAVTTWVGMASAGIALGIFAGFVFTSNKKRRG